MEIHPNQPQSLLGTQRSSTPHHHHHHHNPLTPTPHHNSPSLLPLRLGLSHPLHRRPPLQILPHPPRLLLLSPPPTPYLHYHHHHPLSPSPPPARPQSPSLVSHKEVPSPKESKLPLNAYLLHNLAHVELNAIDLAWDTVVRFAPMREALGDGFFEDFARVADDESRHFTWCSQRLAELGFKYGDMPAHDLLWRECERSSGDVAARLAVIPLVQEARGLDAGPRLVQKLIGFGDHRTSNIVAKIAEEEVAHVAVGVFWFMSVCQKMGRVPCVAFRDLLEEFNVELKGPFNYAARDEAGIPRDWYDGSSTCQSNKELSEVHDRLAHIISMEKENSSLESHPL